MPLPGIGGVGFRLVVNRPTKYIVYDPSLPAERGLEMEMIGRSNSRFSPSDNHTDSSTSKFCNDIVMSCPRKFPACGLSPLQIRIFLRCCQVMKFGEFQFLSADFPKSKVVVFIDVIAIYKIH